MYDVYLNNRPSQFLSASQLLDAVRIGLSACVAERKHSHPDGDRQRSARRKALERRKARRLKAQYVPLYYVDPTVWIQYTDYEGRTCFREDVIPTRVVNGQRVMSWTDYGERVLLGHVVDQYRRRYFPNAGRRHELGA